jgi:hypothetical protein
MKYRKIDAIFENASVSYTNSESTGVNAWSAIPSVTDQVSLVTELGYPMMAEVLWFSEDNGTLRGKVTHGYYPENKVDWISDGELVEFSSSKVAEIHRK